MVTVLVLAWAALLPAGEGGLASIERLVAQGKFRQALEELQRTPPSLSSTARWHLLASKAYDGLDDPARAVAEAEAALALDLTNESHHLQLAQIFLTRNTPAPAYEILTEAQQIFPDSLLIRLGRGLALKELQRYNEAEKELLECLRRKPDFALAFDVLGTVYLNSGRPEDLLPLADQYRRRNPADFRAYYYGAAARHALNIEAEETERLLRRSMELRPNFAASHGLLGKILLNQEKFAQAVPYLERAVRLRPDYSPSHLHLANAYRELGRMEDSKREFAIVRELKQKENQPFPVLKYHRGRK